MKPLIGFGVALIIGDLGWFIPMQQLGFILLAAGMIWLLRAAE